MQPASALQLNSLPPKKIRPLVTSTDKSEKPQKLLPINSVRNRKPIKHEKLPRHVLKTSWRSS